MPSITVPIMRGDKVADNADYRDAMLVNYTVVNKPVLGAPGYILSHAGIRPFATGVGADRGGRWNERRDEHFRVSGDKLIIANAGTVNEVGTVSGTDQASMTHSFTTQSVVADGKWYLYDGSFSQITDSDLGSPIDHTWIDGYYFFTDGEYLYHTNILNEREIDPLQFATSEFSPDPTLGVAKTSDNQVVAFNRYTTEFFANRATDNFAFQRIQAKAVKCGIVGTHCKVEMKSNFYIMGGGRDESISLHIIGAGFYEKFASREVEQIIASYTETELKKCVLETRMQDKHYYILVRLPNHTLLYNATVADAFGVDQAWTVVKSSVIDDGPWRGVNGVFKPDTGWIYGDLNTDDIGVLDPSIATQYGEQVESIFYTPFFRFETSSINKLELDILPGHQLNTQKVTSFLSMTYNGVSYGKEYSVLYGEQHDYSNRFVARRLGYVGDYTAFKVRTVSSERLAFSQCEVDYS